MNGWYVMDRELNWSLWGQSEWQINNQQFGAKYTKYANDLWKNMAESTQIIINNVNIQRFQKLIIWEESTFDEFERRA